MASVTPKGNSLDTTQFSEYIIFADESGDHGLTSIDPQFPVFSLVFCIIQKRHYMQAIAPAIQKLKMELWGHDQVILHERDIRKEQGHFSILRTDRLIRERFLADLTDLVATASFDLIASVIDKKRLRERYSCPYNPYEIALLFCMERALQYLCEHGQSGKCVPILFESRGRHEDKNLEIEFKRICENRSNFGQRRTDFQKMKFEHLFIDKKSNSAGLQLADLVARPLALRHMKMGQANRALEALQGKIAGFKVFP